MADDSDRGEILLKDGVPYRLHTYADESELESVVFEHVREVFGPSALLFPKKKLRTRSGVGSVPDAFVLDIERVVWTVVEVELASHPVFEHVVNQVSKFHAAIQNQRTTRALSQAFYEEITGTPELRIEFERRGITEVHKFVYELLEQPPELKIVFDDVSQQAEEALSALPMAAQVVQLRTYWRDGEVPQDHVHRFCPGSVAAKDPKRPTPPTREVKTGGKRRAGRKHGKSVSHAGKRIRAFTVLGDRKTAEIWKDLLIGVCAAVHEEHPDDFDRILDLQGKRRVWFAREKGGMREPRPIGESGIYVETHWNADGLCGIARQVLERFGHTESDLVIEEE